MNDNRGPARSPSPFPLLVALVAGCVPAGPRARTGLFQHAPPPSFPTPAQLAEITAKPVPARLFDGKPKDVPRWDLVGPLPDAIEPKLHEDTTAWGKMIDEAAGGRPVATTEALHCVARENGAFYLDNESLPADALQRFVAARCGASSSIFGSGVQGLKFDDRMPEDKVVAALREPAAKMLKSLLQAGEQVAGIAYVRKKGRAAVSMVTQHQRVRLDPTPFTPGPDGKVTIRGELVDPAAMVLGYINRGRFGYARCTADLRVRLPRFALECPAAKDDEAAWVEVAAFPTGRVLGATILEMLVWPSGAPGKTYARLGAASAGAAPVAISNAELLASINRVRKEAGLGPVSLVERQSATAARLAPYYFEAGGQGPVANDVSLGLLAGWEVDGMVRKGSFVSTWLRDPKDADDVLGWALARPYGREALLNPAAERVAIGALAEDKGRAHAALIASYAMFDNYRHDGDAPKVLARLAALRAARGLPPAQPLAELDPIALRAAQSVQSGARSPDDALQDMINAAAHQVGGFALGGVTEATALEEMIFPEQIMAQPGLRLAVGVAHYKPAGHPWGRFIVYYVTASEAGVMTARREGPGRG